MTPRRRTTSFGLPLGPPVFNRCFGLYQVAVQNNISHMLTDTNSHGLGLRLSGTSIPDSVVDECEVVGVSADADSRTAVVSLSGNKPSKYSTI